MTVKQVGAWCALAVAFFSSADAAELRGTVRGLGMRRGADAVVYIDAIPGRTFPVPRDHAVVETKDLVFAPTVLPVLMGTTVDFMNRDEMAHNVFSPDKCAGKFDLGKLAQGQSRSHTFNAPCTATLLCSIHPEMEGFILALPTPYFSRLDKTGAYAIRDLPDGDYRVKFWHPKIGEQSQRIKVSGAIMVDFEIR